MGFFTFNPDVRVFIAQKQGKWVPVIVYLLFLLHFALFFCHFICFFASHQCCNEGGVRSKNDRRLGTRFFEPGGYTIR